MAVDDHGLEALKKSAEQVTPGDKSNYYLKVKDTLALAALNEIVANLGGTPSGVKQLTDFSDSVSTSSVEIIPANEARQYLRIQNLETSSKVLFINFVSAASITDPGSYRIGPGETFLMDNFCSTQAVNAISSSGSLKFTAKEGETV